MFTKEQLKELTKKGVGSVTERLLAQLLLHQKAYDGSSNEVEFTGEGTCRYCGVEGRWGHKRSEPDFHRIYVDGEIHDCPKHPKNDPKAPRDKHGKLYRERGPSKPRSFDKVDDDDIPF